MIFWPLRIMTILFIAYWKNFWHPLIMKIPFSVRHLRIRFVAASELVYTKGYGKWPTLSHWFQANYKSSEKKNQKTLIVDNCTNYLCWRVFFFSRLCTLLKSLYWLILTLKYFFLFKYIVCWWHWWVSQYYLHCKSCG